MVPKPGMNQGQGYTEMENDKLQQQIDELKKEVTELRNVIKSLQCHCSSSPESASPSTYHLNSKVTPTVSSSNIFNILANSSHSRPRRRCRYCHQTTHWSDSCRLYPTADSRKSVLNESQSCHLCLSSYHRTTSCNQPVVCVYCRTYRRHHRSICPTRIENYPTFTPLSSTSILVSPKHELPSTSTTSHRTSSSAGELPHESSPHESPPESVDEVCSNSSSPTSSSLCPPIITTVSLNSPESVDEVCSNSSSPTSSSLCPPIITTVSLNSPSYVLPPVLPPPPSPLASSSVSEVLASSISASSSASPTLPLVTKPFKLFTAAFSNNGCSAPPKFTTANIKSETTTTTTTTTSESVSPSFSTAVTAVSSNSLPASSSSSTSPVSDSRLNQLETDFFTVSEYVDEYIDEQNSLGALMEFGRLTKIHKELSGMLEDYPERQSFYKEEFTHMEFAVNMSNEKYRKQLMANNS